jgi:Transposase IS4
MTKTIVVADSYFASVQAALRLKRAGLRFIGTIKTATTSFPMKYLGNKVLANGRGDRHGVIAKDEASGCRLMAFVWCDRDRRYFITTCASLEDGPPCIRKRWRQIDKAPNAKPEYVQVVVAQPLACYVYYAACGRIDQHNRLRQASLKLEKKIATTLWHRRVNMTLFAMMVVDSFLLMEGCRNNLMTGFRTSRDFFMKLAEELIENTHDSRARRKRKARAEAANDALACPGTNNLLPSHLQTISIIVTKKKKVRGSGNCSFQGRCIECGGHTIWVCQECQRFQPNVKDTQYHICKGDKDDKLCMAKHILFHHPEFVKEPFDYEMDG